MSKVDQLLELTSTLDAEKSQQVWYELCTGLVKWVRFDGRLYPDKVRELTNQYVGNHSCIDLPYDVAYTSDPMAVFRFTTQEYVTVEGILYSNGAAARIITKESIIPMLWIDPDTIRLFGYPESLNESEEV